MGKYAPVIKTAECGSMTRAAQTMGYTQPSLGYIINNIENELGVKIFYRDQRGVTMTEACWKLCARLRPWRCGCRKRPGSANGSCCA